MRKFETWLQDRHPEFLEEGLIDWGKKAMATGLAAGALTFGQGCTGNNCPSPSVQDAPPIQAVHKQPAGHAARMQQQGGTYISIDDGRQVPIPNGMDPIEYLQHVNQVRADMGQPPLPIEKTMQYLNGLRGR